jgi:hypothetical protein
MRGPTGINDKREVVRHLVEHLGYMGERHLEKLAVRPVAFCVQEPMRPGLCAVVIANMDVVENLEVLGQPCSAAQLLGTLGREMTGLSDLDEPTLKSRVAKRIEPAHITIEGPAPIQVLND